MSKCINCEHCNTDEEDIYFGECFYDKIKRDPYSDIECDDYELYK